MTAESERPASSPLLNQLDASLTFLEQVVARLDSDPELRQQFSPETLQRLVATTETVTHWTAAVSSDALETDEAAGTEQEWEGIDDLLDSFDSPPAAPIDPPVNRPQPTQALNKTKTAAPWGILRWVATGLLGVFIGVILWIGYPPLSVPPLLTWLGEQEWFSSDSAPISQVDSPRFDNSETSGDTASSLTEPLVAPTIPDVDEPESSVPDKLIAPAPPQAVTVMPLPEAPLTPEQNLIAVIQQEITDLEGLFPPELLQQLKPDFQQSLLSLTLGDPWLTLTPKQQTMTLNALWQRAQQLSFNKLQVYDPQGNLVARSPVVGKNLVILQSETSLPEN